MFLAGVGDEKIRIRCAVDVAYQPVALVHGLTGSAPVPGERHPARVDQDPSLLRLAADHCGHDGKRDIVDGAHADAVHHQIEKHEYTRAHLGDAAQVLREMCSWCGADADLCRSEAVTTQKRRRGDGGRSLRLRGFLQPFAISAGIGLARMRQHATDFHATTLQDAGDPYNLHIVGSQAAAMAVAIYLDQSGEGRTARARGMCQRFRLVGAIENHRDVYAALPKCEHAGDFVGRKADGIDHVGDAGSREVFGFLDR